jgi:ketosteroid isomerase-like protein
MSRDQNERLLRHGMEAYSRGDFEEAVRGFHPDIEWSAETDLVPDAAVYRGHAGVRRFWATWAEAIEGMAIVIEECRAIDDHQVLALLRARGTGHGSGAPVESGRFAQLAEVREGQVVRIRLFGDIRRALAAAGVDTPP